MMITRSKQIDIEFDPKRLQQALMGTLYYGDNLEILRKHIKTESVDLIYLDPPFNSNVNYNVIFKTKNKDDSPSQIQAFEDTWKWNTESEMTYSQILGIVDRISDVLKGLREAIGTNDMMAYIIMMSIRLLELHKVLKKTGSLYLHCDPTASHYLKIILDAIFYPENFRNEIIWCYTGGGSSKKNFGKKHDVILRYSKTNTFNFNGADIRIPYNLDTTKRKSPKAWGSHNNKTYKPNDQGKIPEDWWVISPVNSQSKERMGYPTQKPIALLERIIKASSNEGDIILDPFCGCGTAIHASQKLNRKWIGIDITHLAIGLIEYRMREAFEMKPKVIGVPTTFESAQALADRDKFQFEAWAVTRINRIMPNQKKGKDRGIDGRGYIPIGNDLKGNPKHAKIIVSVKGGQRLTPSMVRDLKGTVTRENAELGIFICIKEPTPEMKREASTGGIFETPVGTKHPKIQIYTIRDYFDGRLPDLPQIQNLLDLQMLRERRVRAYN